MTILSPSAEETARQERNRKVAAIRMEAYLGAEAARQEARDKAKLRVDQVTEIQPHLFEADASDIGLPPGVFPTMILTTIGNGQPLVAKTKKVRGGDVLYVRYAQQLGCVELLVHND